MLLQRDDARQRAPLDELERRAAAGRAVGDARGEPELVHRGERVAAADHRCSGRVGDRVRHRLGARREGVDLEDAHRAVPEDRLRARRFGGVGLRRLGSDVEAHPAVRDLASRPSRSAPASSFWATTWSTGSSSSVTGVLRGGENRAAASSMRSASTQRGADGLALRTQERVRHRAADADHVGAAHHRFEHRELVGHLGAAEQAQEGPRGVEHAAQVVEFRPQQVAGCRALRVRTPCRPSTRARGARCRRRRSRRRRRVSRAPPRSPGRSSPPRRGSAGSRAAAPRRRPASRRPPRRRGRRSPRRTRPVCRAARRAASPPGRASTSRRALPFGRPRCDASTTRAPAASSFRSVGSVARMRVSSPT